MISTCNFVLKKNSWSNQIMQRCHLNIKRSTQNEKHQSKSCWLLLKLDIFHQLVWHWFSTTFYNLSMFKLSCFSKFLPLGPTVETPLLVDHGVQVYGIRNSIWFSKWVVHRVHTHAHVHTHIGSMTLAPHVLILILLLHQDKAPIKLDRY